MLQTLSGGSIYDALELKKPENARQLTGTNLELYYSGLREDEMRGIEEFRKNPLTKVGYRVWSQCGLAVFARY